MSAQTIYLIVYFGMMPIWFVPVCRYVGGMDGDQDMFLDTLLVIMFLLTWPVWGLVGVPFYGLAKLVKYTINHEPKKREVKAS